MKRKRKRAAVWTPRYRVDVELRAQDLAKAGSAVRFTVEGSDGRVGTLEIGQGSLRWRGFRDQKFRRISWGVFFDRLERE